MEKVCFSGGETPYQIQTVPFKIDFNGAFKFLIFYSTPEKSCYP